MEQLKIKFRIVIVMRSMIVMLFLVLPLSINISTAYAATDDYPAKWKNVRMDSALDDWREYNRECTSFVAWRLSSRNGFNMPFWGNASSWAAKARTHNYVVNATPAIGSVARASNHVAWVEAVNGSTVTIEEYNYGQRGRYNERTVLASNFKYIHFKDLNSAREPPLSAVSDSNYVGSDKLETNQAMKAGHYILSKNAQFILLLKNDGNLIVYRDGQVKWATDTSGSGAQSVMIQSDGNLVLRRADNSVAWSSNTPGKGMFTAVMQDNGNLAVKTPENRITWESKTGDSPAYNYVGSDHLGGSQTLSVGQYIRSMDKRYVVLMQNDGDLVVYGPAYAVLWNSKTAGFPGARAFMKSNGDLVVYSSQGFQLWNSNTGGQGSAQAIVHSDSSFAVHKDGAAVIWSTKARAR